VHLKVARVQVSDLALALALVLVVLVVLAQVLVVRALVLVVLELVLAVHAQAAPVVLVLVALVVLALVLALVLVDPVAQVALVVHAPAAVLEAAVLVAAVLVVAVLAVHAMVNVVHHVRNHVHVVVENLKNCSRSSRNTPTAMPLFQKAPSWWSVGLLHKNLHPS
jgi:hypothetical protein